MEYPQLDLENVKGPKAVVKLITEILKFNYLKRSSNDCRKFRSFS